MSLFGKPVEHVSPGAPCDVNGEGGYGIGDLIRLLKAIPIDHHPELVVQVIKTTLESVGVKSSAVIEDAGFTIIDDLVHGYGGGYLPPIVGSKSRPAGQMPTFPLEQNMCLVVQPNVITRDMKAGVQVGELVRVTATGFGSLHRTPHGMFRAGQAI